MSHILQFIYDMPADLSAEDRQAWYDSLCQTYPNSEKQIREVAAKREADAAKKHVESVDVAVAE